MTNAQAPAAGAYRAGVIDEFLGAQVTDTTIRVAVAAKSPYEARIVELVKQ